MLTLAEIADKVSLPSDPRNGALAIGAVSLALGVILSIAFRRVRWLALLPSALIALIWYAECTDKDFAAAIPIEFGTGYAWRLAACTLGVHLPIVFMLILWPRRWSVPLQFGRGCPACGYDVRGLK